MTKTTPEPLFFQDVISPNSTGPQQERKNDDNELSLAFFELANVTFVGFRLASHQRRKPKNNKTISIVVKQDTSACGQHTGGIVWETSYLLINYLLSLSRNLGNTLEVGAGCGLLGLVLAASKWAKRVVLTETDSVIENLHDNVKRNDASGSKRAMGCALDWQNVERDVEKSSKLEPHSFDTIVGTDVIFTSTLVEPLLHTLQYMSHENTVVYLCLQVRCADSHKMLLEKAPSFGWKIKDISCQLSSIPDCAWGQQMECILFKLSRIIFKGSPDDKKRKAKRVANKKTKKRKKK